MATCLLLAVSSVGVASERVQSHKHWLEHFVENTPGFERVDPVPYLQRAVGSR